MMGSLFKGNKGYLEHFTLSLGRKLQSSLYNYVICLDHTKPFVIQT